MIHILKCFNQKFDTDCLSTWIGETDTFQAVFVRWGDDYLLATIANRDLKYYDDTKVNILDDCKIEYFEYHPVAKSMLTIEMVKNILKDKFCFDYIN